VSTIQQVQTATEPIKRYAFKLFDDNKKDIISFSNYFAEKVKDDKARQLSECAKFWGQQSQAISASKTNIVTITDLGESLHIFVEEAATTTDGIKKEFLFDAITTLTAGSEVVFALEKDGQHEAAEFFKAAMKEKLSHIQDSYQHKSSTASTENKTTTLDQELEADKSFIPQLMQSGDLDESLVIAGKSAEEQARILKGAALGVVDGVVCAADPRNIVTGTAQLIRAGWFVVGQLGRLEAYQEAIERGNF